MATQPKRVNTQPETAPEHRVRLGVVTLQFQAFVDDGETLHPIQVQPLTMQPRDIAGIDLDAFVAELQEHVTAQ